jgi:hypothetical protein
LRAWVLWRIFEEQKNVEKEKSSMNSKREIPIQKVYACENCAARANAEANPERLLSKLWRWHTGWCPGWKAYQKHLSEAAKQRSALDR